MLPCPTCLRQCNSDASHGVFCFLGFFFPPLTDQDVLIYKLSSRDTCGTTECCKISMNRVSKCPSLFVSLSLSLSFLSFLCITAGCGDQPGVQGQSLGLCQRGEAKHRHTPDELRPRSPFTVSQHRGWYPQQTWSRRHSLFYSHSFVLSS